MDALTNGGLAIAGLLLLLSFGVPIVWAMSLVAASGMYLVAGPVFAIATFKTLPVATVSNYSLVVIPMFLLMGSFCFRARIIEGLYDAAHRFTACTKGNLLIATVLASAAFAAASGSSLAASSMFARVAMPQMLKYKYAPGVAAACIAATGTLAAIIAGLLFSRFLAVSGFITTMNTTIAELGVSPFTLMACMIAIYLILGMFVDSLSLLVITLPTLFPISQSVGLDPVWFAIISIKLVEIAAITPPVGLNLFAVLGATDAVSSTQLFRGIVPFIVLELVTLTLLIAFPVIATWLPSQM